MNNKEWKRLRIPIFWSIYVDSSVDDIDYWTLDFHVKEDVPDGIYDVRYYGEVRQHGVEVADGHFDPIPTALAIYSALVKYYQGGDFDHRFVERMNWNAEHNCFDLITGS